MEWAPRIRTGFHVSRPTWDTAAGLETSRTGLSPSAAGLSRPLRSNLIPLVPSRNPAGQARRFGLLRVRSPLLAESLLISSPRGTEMFHFPRSRLPPLLDSGRDGAARPAPDCSIRKPMDQSSPATPHGLSRLAASFIACRRLGIRHAPEQLAHKILFCRASASRCNFSRAFMHGPARLEWRLPGLKPCVPEPKGSGYVPPLID